MKDALNEIFHPRHVPIFNQLVCLRTIKKYLLFLKIATSSKKFVALQETESRWFDRDSIGNHDEDNASVYSYGGDGSHDSGSESDEHN